MQTRYSPLIPLAIAIVAAVALASYYYYESVVVNEWKTYTEPLFSVQFPAAPVFSARTGADAYGYQLSTNDTYSSIRGTSNVFVGVGEFATSTDALNPHTMLQTVLANILSEKGNEIATSSFEQFAGSDALQVSYYDTQNAQHIRAMFIVWNGAPYGRSSRYYVLAGIYPKGLEDSRFNSFINSFKITS